MMRFIYLFFFIFAISGLKPVQASEQKISHLDQVLANKTLRVCIWPGYFAISYRNPHTNELEGIDIDMAKELARDLDVKLKFVDSSFAKLIENMTTDACDISMHGIGIREDRMEFMDFSAPHLSSGIYAVAVKHNPIVQVWDDIDQAGNIVVVQKGTYMEPVMKNYLKEADISVVDSFAAREQDVLAGRADVFMTDYPYGIRMTSLTNWAQLLAPEKVLAPTPYAYAVPKGDQKWLDYVNEFLAKVKADGRLEESAKAHGLLPILVK